MNTKKVSRRRFLSTSSAALAAAASATAVRKAPAQTGANEKLAVALIGCGGQGRGDAEAILRAGGDGVVLAAIADIDQGQLNKAAKFFDRKFSAKPEQYKDFRRIIERKDIDIVVVGTPDHWHAIPTILACQAGKDVYVEKPCSHNINEGRAMVKAARKYKRIVQVGQQQRSDAHFIAATGYLRNGKPLGTISRTLTCNYGNEDPVGIGNPPDSDPPPGVDYDMWLGPAPKRPFNPNRFHQRFRWFFDYAAGMIGDWNVHIQDVVHWGMGVDAPLSVYAVGGQKVIKDNRETPTIMDVIYEYPGFHHIYTMTKIYEKGRYRNNYGTEFFGTKGSLFIDRGGWEVTPQKRYPKVPDPDNPGKFKRIAKDRTPAIKKPGRDFVVPHAKNFLDCVRSRKVQNLHCDIEVGHRTATACHLGNIALRVGRKIWWDAKKEMCILEDGSADMKANIHLKREYRKGYELPVV